MTIHHGCYFHYCQSLYKQIQQLSLSTAYLEDDSIPEMGDFFKYFKYQWLTRVPPRYWNVSMLNFRTNNFTEGELSSFQEVLLSFVQ